MRNMAIGLALVAMLAFVASTADAQTQPAYQEGYLDSVVDQFQRSTHTWEPKLQQYARNLLFLLAVIGLAWQGIQVALKRSDWNDVIREVVMLTMTVGFYLFVIENLGEISTALLDSFEAIATDLIDDESALLENGDIALSPSGVLGMGWEIFTTLTGSLGGNWITNPGQSIFIAAAGLITAILFAGIAAYIVLVKIEGFIVTAAGVIFLGFAGIEFTLDIAKNYLRYLLSFAVKLFAVYIIMATGLTILEVKVMGMLDILNQSALSGISRSGLLTEVAFWALVVPLVILILSFMVPAVMVQIVGGMGSHSNFALNSVLTTTLMTASGVGQSAMKSAGGIGGIAGGVNQAGMAAVGGLQSGNPMSKVGAYMQGAGGAFGDAMQAGGRSAMNEAKTSFNDNVMNGNSFMRGVTGSLFPGQTGAGGSAGGSEGGN